VTAGQAKRFAEAWVAAWNAHDLERILIHYADTLEFISPLIAERLGLADGTIRDKESLRSYFALGLDTFKDLRFELIELLTGPRGVTIYYRNQRGRTVAETMLFDANGKVVQAIVHYS